MNWQTTKQANVHCGKCGKIGSCTVSPDGKAFKCWPDGGRVVQTGPARTAYTTAPAPRPKTGRTYPTADAAIEAAGRSMAGGVLATVWVYTDRAGADVMRVVRFDLPDESKQFRPVHRAGDGWKIGDPPGKLPLYRLADLPSAGPVYVCEGEKATDAACAINLAAVTSAHGSSSAGKTDWTPLAGRDVIILPDADEPGEKYARDVTAILAGLIPPAKVKIVRLPDLPDGGDIVEYIAASGTREKIEQLAGDMEAGPTAGPVLTCLADVQAREIAWLWPGRVPMGRITLLVGRPGEGKSFLTTDATARVTTGTPWPDGSPCPAGSVVLISAEDDPADTIRPRLDAHHADCRKVHLLAMVRRIGEDGTPRETMFTLADVFALEQVLKQVPDCRLVVIDPIGSFLGGGTDAHRDNEVRAVLAPVAKLAEKYGPAVLVVAHRRKSAGTNADETALGSRAFTGIARAVWHLSRDPQNKARRLLLPGKNNLAPEGDGLAFTIGGEPASIFWEKEPVKMNADEALAAENAGDGVGRFGPEPEARTAAENWLLEQLADGELPAKAIKKEVKDAGMVFRTVQRAAESLGIIREKNQFSEGWQWRLPKVTSEGDKSLKDERLVHLSPSVNSPENAVFSTPAHEDDKSFTLGILGENEAETAAETVVKPERQRGQI